MQSQLSLQMWACRLPYYNGSTELLHPLLTMLCRTIVALAETW
jgi:hypothetical protein